MIVRLSLDLGIFLCVTDIRNALCIDQNCRESKKCLALTSRSGSLGRTAGEKSRPIDRASNLARISAPASTPPSMGVPGILGVKSGDPKKGECGGLYGSGTHGDCIGDCIGAGDTAQDMQPKGLCKFTKCVKFDALAE